MTEQCFSSNTFINCLSTGTFASMTSSARSVSQAQRFLLTHVGHMDHVRNLAHDLEQVVLAFFLEHLLQFVTDVEMILNRALAASGDNNDLVASRCQRLFHAILNDGLI